MRRAPALALLLLLACAESVDRAEWQRMSRDEKTLYVNSLLGAEKAKAAKGGTARAYPRPAGEYVRRIDEAYARGETRDAESLFTSLGEAPR